jgi:hypothetical protein
MSNYRKHIDNFFREKLGNYRETPPPDVWEQLEGRLDGLAPVPTVSYKWVWHLAVISVIVFLGVSVGKRYVNPGTENHTAVVAGAEVSRNITGDNIPAVPAASTKTVENGMTGTNTEPVQTEAANNVPENNTKTAHKDNLQNTHLALNSSKTQNGARKGGNKITLSNQHKNGNKNSTINNKNAGSGKLVGNLVNTDNIYNATTTYSKPAPAEETNNDQNTNASPNTTLSVVESAATPAKKETAKTPSVVAAKNSKTKNRPAFPRFEAGVKVGYEGGFTNDAAQTVVLSPYLQFNLSPKFALMVQPALKYATLRNKELGTPQTYYSINEDGRVVLNSVDDQTIVIGPNRYPKFVSAYTYSQSHDSIIKSNKIGGSSMQYELPVLLKFNISKQFSVYGGVNLVLCKSTTITEQTFTAKGLSRSYNDTIVTTEMPNGNPILPGFNYTGSDISTYTGALKSNNTSSQLNAGYMIGFTYAYHKKWLFDALLQQTSAKSDIKAGYDINSSLSTPYLRLSIGYKLK